MHKGILRIFFSDVSESIISRQFVVQKAPVDTASGSQYFLLRFRISWTQHQAGDTTTNQITKINGKSGAGGVFRWTHTR